ncbi:MAG: GntR family transcriptional regulator [Thermaceae bacterium]|nr:GntR family transcriptional regulator [Thermaceae bacterium]
MARRLEARPELNLRLEPRLGTNRTKEVYETLKEAILTQQLPPTTPLIESQLAQALGLSKTPVREALLHLANEGLVNLEPIKGASVHSLSLSEIRDIFEMRLHLEPLALIQSAPLLSEAELGALEQLLVEAESALVKPDFARLSLLNLQFHRGLYSAASNRLLVGWLDSLGERRRLLSLQGWQRHNRSLAEWQEHRAILRAVQKGQTEVAALRLREHIEQFYALLEHPQE